MSTEIELLDALKEVIDPELMVNIVDLGLIYDVAQDGETVNPAAIRFVNRLSDFLFVAARWVNDKGRADVLWVPGKNR